MTFIKNCPICEYENKELVRSCPGCGAVERQRAFSTIAKKNKFNFEGRRILLVAGSNPEYTLLRKLGAINIDRVDIKQDEFNTISADICNLNVIENLSYDIIYASFSLTTTYDVDATLSEFHRILNSTGRLMTCDPINKGTSVEFLDIDKITGRHGMENYISHRIGEFRMLGEKTLLPQLKKFFDPTLIMEKDINTTKDITWIISSKKNNAPKLFTRRTLDLPDIYLTPGNSYTNQKKFGFKPRSNLAAWPFDNKINWGADPFGDSNWIFQLQAWRMLDPIFREWLEVRNKDLLDEAIEIIFDWDNFVTNQQENSAAVWSDMASGIRSLKLAFIFDLMHSGHLELSESKLKKITLISLQHIDILKEPTKLTNSNHGYFQLFGLHRLSQFAARNSDEKKEISLYVQNGLETLINNHFTEEGIHKEHSPEYHIFVINILKSLGAMKLLQDPAIKNIIKNAANNSQYFIFPDKSISEIGDTSPAKFNINEKNIATTASKKWVKYPHTSIIDFYKSGYSIIKSKNQEKDLVDEMLIFTGNFYNHVHKHQDDLSFEFYTNGKKIFIDPGKYSYNRDEKRKYILSGLAHNTVASLNKDFEINQFKPHGSSLNKIQENDDFIILSGQVNWKNFHDHKRKISYIPLKSLIIEDILINNNDSILVSTLNINPICKISQNQNKIIIDDFISIESDSGIIEIETGIKTKSYGNTEEISKLLLKSSDKNPKFNWIITINLQNVSKNE
jgi:hypothetical protein